jgi:hypothetical protein
MRHDIDIDIAAELQPEIGNIGREHQDSGSPGGGAEVPALDVVRHDKR